MKFTQFALSRRYARAFLSVFYPAPQLAPLEPYKQLLDFFHTHPAIVGLIANCPCPQSCYSQLEDFLITKFNLTIKEKKLFHRLLVDRQVNLLASIVENLIDLEHIRRNELVCTIELSHEISDDAMQKIVGTFETMIKLKILPKIVIKPKLICGVRMYTKTVAYEHSIDKNLSNAKTLAKTKGGLW